MNVAPIFRTFAARQNCSLCGFRDAQAKKPCYNHSMPKSLSFGNGSALVCIDKYARLRDLYFPYVGLENHVGGKYAHRLGIWQDDRFSWLDDGSWELRTINDDGNRGITTAISKHFGLTVTITDVLYNEKNIFLRKFSVSRIDGKGGKVKIFFNQQFEIYHSEKGDTAFYDPATHTVIHYEGRRAFLLNVIGPEGPFDDYTTGIFQIEGKEGTFRDAEDGMLAKNPIEHGLVDSTLGITLNIPEGGTTSCHYWIAMGELIEEAKQLNTYVLERSPEYLMHSTADFWRAWSNRLNLSYYGLGEGVIELFKQSQFYMRSHVDRGGAIIASGDSDMLQSGRDTYSYMWPRDAAYVAVALDWIGDRHGARKFFELCADIITEEGYLMHKYRPDRSLGSSWHGWVVDGKPELPIQEDETALVLWALWEHWEASRDLDFIESIYNSFIKKAAIFLASYRDPYTGLPKPSYNLWEERFGVHTYTAATVYAGLSAAARFAEILGKERGSHNFEHVATEMQRAILKHLYNAENGTFYKSIYVDKNGKTIYDLGLDASSAYAIYQFGVLPVDDPRIASGMQIAKDRLTVRTSVGGIARYEGDQYYRTVPDVPGNPWFITTLWYAQYYCALAKNDQDLDRVREILEWARRNALPSGVLSEQLDPYTGVQVSAGPLTWSHAEYIRTVVMYLRKVQSLGIAKTAPDRL